MKNTLKVLRAEHNLTQREISKILEVSQAQYSAYENGKLRMTVAFLIKAADYYETSVDYIICRVKAKEPYPHFFKPHPSVAKPHPPSPLGEGLGMRTKKASSEIGCKRPIGTCQHSYKTR